MNFMKIIYENCKVKNNMKEDYRSCKTQLLQLWKKAWKNSGLYGIQTIDLSDTGAALWLPIELTSQLGAGHWIVWY